MLKRFQLNFIILMKHIIALGLLTVLFSCQKETRDKVKDAGKAVGTEMKQGMDSVKKKAAKVIDTAKVKEKTKTIIAKGAESVENGAKKIKESTQKKS